LTVAELAAWLRVKKSTIRKRVCYRRIPFIKIGRSVRFKREDIEAWLIETSVQCKSIEASVRRSSTTT
jgi:excisionase family DNA binding protein